MFGSAFFKMKRENEMNLAATKIQRFWKTNFNIHTAFLYQAKKHCKPDYVLLLQEKRYSLVLKKACDDLNLPLVVLLLKYKDQLNIQINDTSSNGNTALDWAQKSKYRLPQNKMKISKLLIAAHAKTGEEIKNSIEKNQLNY